MNEVEARDFIPGLSDEFTAQELKRLFRKQSLVKHPDTVTGSDEEFKLLVEAYNVLSKIAFNKFGKKLTELKTVKGVPLVDLGKGYPLNVSAIECENCEGKGYKGFSSRTRPEQCPDCKGEGTFFLPCKKCKGTGDYIHPKINKVVGKCNWCDGSGKFYPAYKRQREASAYMSWSWMNFVPDNFKYVTFKDGSQKRVNICKKCRGEGIVQVLDDGYQFYSECQICSGIGEIKIYNPVLPRGYLVAK
jgi:DnaJ-class molecular chaperone